jgi:hypothetical protein
MHYYGMLILVSVIALFATWYWMIYAITAPAKNEKISFFVEAEALIDENFENDLRIHLKNKGLLEVRVYTMSIYNSDMANQYERFGTEADFLILRDIDLVDMAEAITYSFIKISNGLIDNILDNLDISPKFYTYGEENYGIKIYDQTDDIYNQTIGIENFCQFAKEEDAISDYYLLFNSNSVNFGQYNSASLSSLAIDAAQFFFQRYQL